MNINMKSGIKGRYKSITVIRDKGKPTERTEVYPGFDNLILDSFFSRYKAKTLSQNGWRFYVGTGSSVPTPSETQLVNRIGGVSDSSTNTVQPVVENGGVYSSSLDVVTQWPVGSIVGNISEIGANFHASTTGTDLQTRSLVVDVLGDPTTITLTVDDQLIVNYELIMTIDVSQKTTVHDFGGVSTTCTIEVLSILRPNIWTIAKIFGILPWSTLNSVYISNATSLQNDINANPSGTVYTVSPLAVNATANGLRVVLAPNASQMNHPGGISYLILRENSIFARQGVLFDPPLAKTNTKIMELYFDYDLARAA